MKQENAIKIKQLREKLHEMPEAGLKEYRTTAAIREAMLQLPVEEILLPCETGCAFRLKAGNSTGTICIRGDIDGLESDGGLCHACGHDHHAAGAYGAAMLLCEKAEKLRYDVVFLFQPAEEYVAGAKLICESDFFEKENISEIYALHNTPDMPVGTVGIKAGALLASKDSFEIKVHGRGGHGASPELCADPIVAAAHIITSLQTVVSRSLNPASSGVLTVSSIHSGSTDNKIEDELLMTGSFRAIEPAVRQRIMQRMEEISSYTAKAFGCEAELSFPDGVPAVINEPALEKSLWDAAVSVCGNEKVFAASASMFSEDFSYYSEKCPSFYFFLGSGFEDSENFALHSSRFNAHPETALYAAEIFAALALNR